MNIIKSESKASVVFDFIRFVSAFAVVVFHGGVDKIPGYEAVMVFFVLSGMFISPIAIREISENRWSWKKYLINRVSRLWIVLIPALILAYIIAQIRIGNFNSDMYEGTMSFKTFVANMFFLGDIKSPIFAANLPLWSLANEFWYYIIFPCLVHIVYAKKISKKLIYLMLVIAISIFVGTEKMMYFPAWLIGAIPIIIKAKAIKSKWNKNLIVVTSTILMFISLNIMYLLYHTNHRNGFPLQIPIDYLVCVCSTLLFYVIISVYGNVNISKNNRVAKIIKYFAGFSYTLYLVHYPMLQLTHDIKKTLNVSKLILNPITLILIVFYAWLISRFTEVHLNKFRKFISGIVDKISNINLLKYHINNNNKDQNTTN